jgi:hypothetical protein
VIFLLGGIKVNLVASELGGGGGFVGGGGGFVGGGGGKLAGGGGGFVGGGGGFVGGGGGFVGGGGGKSGPIDGLQRRRRSEIRRRLFARLTSLTISVSALPPDPVPNVWPIRLVHISPCCTTE